MTTADGHMWLAPYTPGAAHTVTLTLPRAERLRALRVWNYNVTRIHSARGARRVRALLDGVPIFSGEIAQVPASLDTGLDTLGDETRYP